MNPEDSLSYRDSGVDIDAGNQLVERIKPAVASTRREGCLGSIGGFGGLFELPLDRYQKPLLVSGTDGVGTKLKLAIDLGIYGGIGIDLVAMCANDIAVLGAEALFFLDYYATGKLELDVAQQVITSIAEGCRRAGCALIGGETAEMPGMYGGADFDLAGFCVGIVEKQHVIDGSRVEAGDCLIALASSGPHSNGYSLVRKIIARVNPDMGKSCGDQTLAEALIEPTRIYVKNLLELASHNAPHAIAHITGGGLTDNIPRVLPEACAASINLSSWNLPLVFQWLQSAGHVNESEMLRTFNCGIGMVLVVKSSAVEGSMALLDSLGEDAWVIGEVIQRGNNPAVVFT